MKSPFLRITVGAAALALAGVVFAHGDVTPQLVDTSELPEIGEEWLTANPYTGNEKAIEVGSSAYNQNCARCHGLEAVSGGIAPDLRLLERDCVTMRSDRAKKACKAEMSEYYLATVRRGRVRNGNVYMPPFEGILNQQAMWAIKAYVETRKPD